MSPLLIDLEANENQPDRFPPCLFPTSDPLPTGDYSTTRGHVELKMHERFKDIEASLMPYGLCVSTIVKASWILTLRCFISTEIICFGYKDDVDTDLRKDGLENISSNDTSKLCLLRVDQDEKLSSFLYRLQHGRKCLLPFLPTGDDVLFVEPQPSVYLCNTAVRCYDRRTANSSASRINYSPWDLTLNVTNDHNDQIVPSIDFWHSHVAEDQAWSTIHTFNYILSQIVRMPDVRIQDIDVCSYHDRQKIRQLTESVSKAEDICVHDMILEQCRRNPHKMAVCSWDGNLTYGELDDLSARLSHHLVRLGVRPETFILSCWEKSTWAIVTRLAILRAGAAYISVHASNPPAYLDSVIRRTNAQLLISDPRYAHQFRSLVNTVVEVTPEWLRSLPVETSPACKEVRSDNACLILFTSGSTGEPKGIIQVHQSYATAIRDYVRNLKLGSHTRFLQFDDYAFDISNLEFLVPLSVGGCCCVPKPMKTVQDLAHAISTMNVNITFLTPTVAIKLDPTEVESLDLLCIGGEALSKDLLDKWNGSRTKLVNQYGMGEVAICCAYNDRIHLGRRGNIGRPASGAIWVIDASSPNKLMPIGAVGELLMEGPHLSRRYLDQISRRSEAVFLDKAPVWMPDMHPERCSARLYRSGDLGRWNHDGTIDYIGRKDTVLKLDGCRIEAIEVEHQARQCLSPKDGIVVDLVGAIDGEEDPVLAAYLYLDDHPESTSPIPKTEPTIREAIGDPHAAAKVSEIQKHIGQSLPKYMIPRAFLLVAWMPRTASNKTDRKKLHVIGERYHMEGRAKRNACYSEDKQSQLLPP